MSKRKNASLLTNPFSIMVMSSITSSRAFAQVSSLNRSVSRKCQVGDCNYGRLWIWQAKPGILCAAPLCCCGSLLHQPSGVPVPVSAAGSREPRHSDGGVNRLAPQFIAGLLVYPGGKSRRPARRRPSRHRWGCVVAEPALSAVEGAALPR